MQLLASHRRLPKPEGLFSVTSLFKGTPFRFGCVTPRFRRPCERIRKSPPYFSPSAKALFLSQMERKFSFSLSTLHNFPHRPKHCFVTTRRKSPLFSKMPFFLTSSLLVRHSFAFESNTYLSATPESARTPGVDYSDAMS